MKTIIIDGIEYNLTPKVLFKKGDWVVYDHRPYQVVELPKESYINLGLKGNGKVVYAPSTYCRHWTIQDAKDGDVLCDYHETYDNPLIFILKKFEHVNFGLVRPSDYSSYCFLTASDRQMFKEGTYHHKHNIKPAAKEQRELLFQKMHEAGYMWDSKSKQLLSLKAEPNVEQKPAWSEEDDNCLSTIIAEFSKCAGKSVSKDEWMRCNDFLNSLKDRVQPKPSWSEEDRRMLTGLIDELDAIMNKATPNEISVYSKYTNWLKSLKARYTWKPSDEQMGALLSEVTAWTKGCPKQIVLESLYNDLKKL